MTKTIRVRYREGRLEPLEPLAMEEGTEMTVPLTHRKHPTADASEGPSFGQRVEAKPAWHPSQAASEGSQDFDPGNLILLPWSAHRLTPRRAFAQTYRVGRGNAIPAWVCRCPNLQTWGPTDLQTCRRGRAARARAARLFNAYQQEQRQPETSPPPLPERRQPYPVAAGIDFAQGPIFEPRETGASSTTCAAARSRCGSRYCFHSSPGVRTSGASLPAAASLSKRAAAAGGRGVLR